MDRSQWENLLRSVNEHMRPDDYPRYTIANLYVDTPDHRLIRRSMEKPVYKEKMRLRSYGKADGRDLVFLELKKKYKGIVYKRRVKMPLDRAQLFLRGDREERNQIEREIGYFIGRHDGLSPAMYISYEREAFRGKEDGDLRLTVDRNILWREANLDLSSEPGGTPVLDEGQLLMEIKCVGSLPLWLTGALSANGIYRTSFSKYGKAYSKRLTAGIVREAG